MEDLIRLTFAVFKVKQLFVLEVCRAGRLTDVYVGCVVCGLRRHRY